MAEKNTRVAGRVKELEAANAGYIAEIGRLQAQAGELSSEVGRLRAELEQKRGVRPAARALYKSLDKAITARLEKRSYRRPKPRRAAVAQVPAGVLSSDDPKVLADAASLYDVQAYFRLNASKTGMRLRYRIAGGLYRAARNGGIYSLKRLYWFAKRGRV